jgi:negative regulator of sigma E activity
MTHTIDYHASKTKKILDTLDGKRDELLKRDRALRELSDEIEEIKAELSEAEAAAANDGHAVSDLHAAVKASEDKGKKAGKK